MRLLVSALLLLFTAAAAHAADFTLKDLHGRSHKLSDYRGKWVVVNYWATWCPPCREEIPELEQFSRQHAKGDAVVLGVNFEDIGARQLQMFVADHGITYPVLRSEPAESTPLGPVPGLPTTYLIAPDGKTVARQVGPITAAALDAYIRRKTEQMKDATPVTVSATETH